jgi:hypothetical protein
MGVRKEENGTLKEEVKIFRDEVERLCRRARRVAG